MDKYLQAEKRLAELLGYTDIKQDPYPYITYLMGVKGGRQMTLQKWTRDNAAAFALMVEHGISVLSDFDGEGVQTFYEDAPHWTLYGWECYPDKETATRYAIVQAVIRKLEAKHD